MGNTVYAAARSGNAAVLRTAIAEDGYDPYKMQLDGSTALHAASTNGHLDCIAILLDHGGDPTLKSNISSRAASHQKTNCCIDEASTAAVKALLMSHSSKKWMDKYIMTSTSISVLISSADDNAFRQLANAVASCFETEHPTFPHVATMLRNGDPIEIIRAYKAESPLYTQVNKALLSSGQQPVGAFVTMAVNVIAAAMGKLASNDVCNDKVFCGGGLMEREEWDLLRPGFRFCPSRPRTMLKDLNVATAFSENVLVVIGGTKELAQRSKYPVCVSGFCDFLKEEVIFPPGTEFIAESREESQRRGKAMFGVFQKRAPVLPHLEDLYTTHNLILRK